MGRSVATSGKHFLKCYAKLASMALQIERPLWVFRPKLHCFDHLILEIKSVVDRGGHPLNPLAYSCAMAEDFIGRASMLSRRASAMTCEKRVIQRYLAAANAVWSKEMKEK